MSKVNLMGRIIDNLLTIPDNVVIEQRKQVMHTATKTQETIKFYVTAREYDPNLDELDWNEQDLILYVVNIGKPLRPQIETLVKARLGQEWRVANWEVDEPTEEYEDEF